MKFNNKKTGQFKSRAEALIWRKLRSVKGTRVKYEADKLPYFIERNYIPDFDVHVLATNKKVYVEVKGFFRPEDRTKMLAVKRSHPNADIRIIFMQDSKLNKKSKSRYSDWATRHGFPYSIGTVPREWFS